MVFLDHIWEGASPVLLHGMPRRLVAVTVSPLLGWHCHWRLWVLLQLLLAGSTKSLVMADFLHNSSPQRSKVTPPLNNDPVQHFKHIRRLSQPPHGPTHRRSCSHPTRDQQAPRHPTAAQLPGGRDATSPRFPWSRSFALAACWSYCLFDKWLEENGELSFFFQRFWRMSCIFLSNMYLAGWQPCQPRAGDFC